MMLLYLVSAICLIVLLEDIEQYVKELYSGLLDSRDMVDEALGEL